jgi:predicted nucleic acid-binding Zn ribbon protein
MAKKKCIHCGRSFESGISSNLCSNSCKQIMQLKARARLREIPL